MINIRSVDLNLLVVFDALFDERSVTGAARRLALTQPTVSGLLKRLRRTFSDPLFVRGSHGVLPTPRAEALAGPIKDLLAKAQSLAQPQAFDPATAEGVVKLCGSDYMQLAIAAPFIERLGKLAPKLKVMVSPRPAAGIADLLARGEIDLCLNAREAALPDLPARLLYRERYICVGRKKHPLKTRRISLKQLCAYDHLLVDPTGRSFVGPVDAILEAREHYRRVAVAVPSFQMLFEILRSGDFLAFVPERLLHKRRSEIRLFETGMNPPEFDVVATWHPRVSADLQHKGLRELLVEVARAPQ